LPLEFLLNYKIMSTELFFQQLCRLTTSGILATVVKVSDNGPCQLGSRLFTHNGKPLLGTVGGGNNEHQLLGLCNSLKDSWQMVDINGPQSIQLNHCGGSLQVIIEQLDLANNDCRSFWNRLEQASRQTRPHLLLSLYCPQTSSRYHLLGDQNGPSLSYPDNIPLFESIESRWSQFMEDDQCTFSTLELDRPIHIFRQPLNRSGRLIILGAGHVARELARLGHRVGFQVLVVDPRRQLCGYDHFPDHCLLFPELYIDFFEKQRIAAKDFLVIMGPDHQTDFELLKMAVTTEAGYIGLMGSRKKINSFLEKLQDNPFLNELENRLHAPIGIDIPSKSPAEVAVAIVAELISKRAEHCG